MSHVSRPSSSRESQDLLCILQAVYQSLLHLGWIDKLLENISTIFIDVYKDQLKGNRARITLYKFDAYFEQQVRELEGNTGSVAEIYAAETGGKKDPFVSSDNGGPPPPPVPGLMKGM
jgi:signal recognition particle receptor subunit alpha